MSETEMPEKIWVSLYETVSVCRPKGYWPGGRWPAVFKQNRDRATPYILKSTVDAEREADSKTIAALAEALGKVDKKLNKFDIKASDFRIGKPCLLVSGSHKIVRQTLSDNAPRIVEAQEANGE